MVYRIKNGYMVRNIADEWIILPTDNASHDFNGMMLINESGAFIWKELEDGNDKEALINALFMEYNVDRETAEKDIEEFLNTLSNCGLLLDNNEDINELN